LVSAAPAKRRRVSLHCLAALALPLAAFGQPAAPSPWRAGAAAIDITPAGSVWQGGFAKRAGPSQGVALPIHAKALALVDGAGTRLVIVTIDLVAIPPGMRTKVEREAVDRYHLAPE